MNMNGVFENIREEAQRFFLTARGSHDWSHTERVHNLCMHIGKKENADLYILSLSAFLHDIGRGQQDKTNGSICHGERGATMARELLERHNLDQRTIGKIIHCIENHRFRGAKVPRTKEAQVLYDADKLDSIGAVGIARAFAFGGFKNRPLWREDDDGEHTTLQEFRVKLVKVKDTLFTHTARQIAQERHQYMVGFFEQMAAEVTGGK